MQRSSSFPHAFGLPVLMCLLALPLGCASTSAPTDPANATSHAAEGVDANDSDAERAGASDAQWSFDGAGAATDDLPFPAMHFGLQTFGAYSDGCSQTTLFGTRFGQVVLDIAPDGAVVAGLQSVSRETVGPGVGGSGAWTDHAWLHTWFYTGHIDADELEDGVLEVTLQPAEGDACAERRPAGWEPWEPWRNEPPGCSQATEPMVLSCVEQRHRLPEPAVQPGRIDVATHLVHVIACEVDGVPHEDLIGPGGQLFLSPVPGLQLSNSRDDNIHLRFDDGSPSGGVLAFLPQTPATSPSE